MLGGVILGEKIGLGWSFCVERLWFSNITVESDCGPVIIYLERLFL